MYSGGNAFGFDPEAVAGMQDADIQQRIWEAEARAAEEDLEPTTLDHIVDDVRAVLGDVDGRRMDSTFEVVEQDERDGTALISFKHVLFSGWVDVRITLTQEEE